MMVKSVNIFVLNWNGKDLTIDCLNSLKKITYANAHIIVIDNGSTDGSVDAISKQFHDYEIIQLEENFGYSKGNNAGFKSVKCKADYTIFLNNDTIVDSNFVEPLINELETKFNTKQTAPKIYYANKPKTIWFAGGIVNIWTGMIRHIGIRNNDSHDYSKKRVIDYATGCCVCMRTEEFESIGMFDESFPMYAEDVDLSLRFKKIGGNIVFIPESKVWHKVSASMRGRFSISKWKRKQKGKMKLLAKHSEPYQIPVSLPLAIMVSILEFIYSLLIEFQFIIKSKK